MANLPQELPWHQADNQWAAVLNPIISNPVLNCILLKNVSLASGDNVVSHKLGRKLQGWYPVRIRASATFFDKQDSNQMQDLTLVLHASAAVTIDLVVF